MHTSGWFHGKKLKLITMAAVFAALVAVCVLLYFVMFADKKDKGITRAEAAKLIAGACVTDDEMAAFNTYDAASGWYTGYVQYAVNNGYISNDNPNGYVTEKDFKRFAAKCGSDAEAVGISLTGKDNAVIKKNDFVNAYIRLLKYMPNGNSVTSITTTVVGTPSNVGNASEWQAYTDDGIMHFAGIALDYAIDRSATLIVRGKEILCVQKTEDMTTLRNAWVIYGNGNTLSVFVGGVKREYKVSKLSQNIDNVMADINLEQGRVTAVNTKTDTISGKVLSADKDYIEIEGYGKVPLDDRYRIYRTYGELSLKDYGALIVGYDLSNFIVADGKICGAAITKPLNADNVRVLLKTDNFASLYHARAELTCSSAFTIVYGSREDSSERHEAGDIINADASSVYLTNGRMKVVPDNGGKVILKSVSRAYGNPEYDGTIEISSEEGGLVIINEVPIEQYLKRVVPSEMPVSYGTEALKVQAVCARSYVYRELDNNNYVSLGAHLDDSTLYQVYNNVTDSAASNEAIEQTEGEILTYNDEPVQTYYYSTSCGVTTDVSLWGSEPDDYPYFVSQAVGSEPVNMDLTVEDNFRAFIKNTKYKDYDRRSELYRWELNVTAKELSDSFNSKLAGRIAAYPDKILVRSDSGDYIKKSISTVGTINNITVEKRVAGGAVVSVIVAGSNATVRISGENNIRYMFGVADVPLVTAEGNFRNMSNLPSAFCIFEPADNGAGFKITGGGYGHGIGMSQNAVYMMVNSAMSYSDVLEFFYPGTKLKTAE